MICPNCREEIEPVEEFVSTITVIKDDEGRRRIWTEEMRDIDGVLVSKREDTYSYLKTGEIDAIVQKVYDDKEKLVLEEVTKL